MSINVLLLFLLLIRKGEHVQPSAGDKFASKRIALGQPASDGMFPFMASLILDSQHYCCGSIITENLVLTAAHCCFNIMINEVIANKYLQISAGSLYWKNGNRHNVAKKIIHEHFVLGKLPNDIALILVEPAFIYSRTLKPINLNPLRIYDEEARVFATVTGWGYTVVKKKTIEVPSDVLMYVDVSTIPRKECSKRLNITILAEQICVFTGTGLGTCAADSGTPLISHGSQVGILSFGADCSNERPEVYTRISDHYYWVLYHQRLLELGLLTKAWGFYT